MRHVVILDPQSGDPAFGVLEESIDNQPLGAIIVRFDENETDAENAVRQYVENWDEYKTGLAVLPFRSHSDGR